MKITLVVCWIALIIAGNIMKSRYDSLVKAQQTELFLYQSALNELLGKSRDFAEEHDYYITQYEDRTDREHPQIWFKFNKLGMIHQDTLNYARTDSLSTGWGKYENR